MGGEVDERGVLVYCRGCHKTHAAGLDERECYPGAWRDDETGARWEDVVARTKGQRAIESADERAERQMRAAAPEMYRALKALLDATDPKHVGERHAWHHSGRDCSPENGPCVTCAARAALALAAGQAPAT